MIECPECQDTLGTESVEDLEVGEEICCESCGVVFNVINLDPFELEVSDGDEIDEDDELDDFDEDDDEDEDEEDEE